MPDLFDVASAAACRLVRLSTVIYQARFLEQQRETMTALAEDLFKELPARRQAVLAVQQELRQLRTEPCRCAGLVAPSAHELAVGMALGLEHELRLYRELGLELFGCKRDWPDAREVIALIGLEASWAKATKSGVPGRGFDPEEKLPWSREAWMKLTRQQRRLLAHMLPLGSDTVANVMRAVWGHEEVRSNTFNQALSRTTRFLVEQESARLLERSLDDHNMDIVRWI
jgi:hypothetical protein